MQYNGQTHACRRRRELDADGIHVGATWRIRRTDLAVSPSSWFRTKAAEPIEWLRRTAAEIRREPVGRGSTCRSPTSTINFRSSHFRSTVSSSTRTSRREPASDTCRRSTATWTLSTSSPTPEFAIGILLPVARLKPEVENRPRFGSIPLPVLLRRPSRWIVNSAPSTRFLSGQPSPRASILPILSRKATKTPMAARSIYRICQVVPTCTLI